MPIGTRLLAHLDPDVFRLGMGVLLLAFSDFMLLGRIRTRVALGRPRGRRRGWLRAGGILGLSGPLPTVWATLRGWGKDERRGVFQSFNLAVLAAAIASHAPSSLLTAELGRLALVALPGTIAGACLGARAYAG